jgi:hypothetical protein
MARLGRWVSQAAFAGSEGWSVRVVVYS